MTNEKKYKIVELREKGLTYGQIAEELTISKNTVASYLKRLIKNKNLRSNCINCGLEITSIRGKKEKKFCDDKCRMQWWNSNKEKVKKRAFYKLECRNCLKTFEAYGNKNRKFCGVDCYNEYRIKGDKNV